jgi:hypothetical protein
LGDYKIVSEMAKRLCFPEKDTDEIDFYLDHDEWGLAYEVLCAVIGIEKIHISQKDYDVIKHLGEIMKMDEWFWKHIEGLVINN